MKWWRPVVEKLGPEQAVALYCTCGAAFYGPVHYSAQQTLTRNWCLVHCGPGHGPSSGPAGSDVFERLATIGEQMEAELDVAAALELAK